MFKRQSEAKHLTRLAEVREQLRQHQQAMTALEAEQHQISETIADMHDPGRIERREAALAERIKPLNSQIKALEKERGEHKAAGNQAGVEALKEAITKLQSRRRELAAA